MDPTLLIGDIVERKVSQKKPEEFSEGSLTSSTSGFPQHKRRWKPSASKQQPAKAAAAGTSEPGSRAQYTSPDGNQEASGLGQSFEESERRRIDLENKLKLDSMTPQEIAKAQEEIINGLNPALVQRLLQRSTIEDPVTDSLFTTAATPEIKVDDTTESAHSKNSKPSSSQLAKPSIPRSAKKIAANYDEDRAPPQIPPDLFPITEQPQSTHFPVPPSLPDLDPSDPNFLATLHEKYFPDLPADPSKLAWMAPVPSKDSPADKESPYYPHPEIGVSALRFDFRGRFLSPRVSRSISTDKGLHHHGEAPEAAGYTIGELARLARSAVPAQRCMAYQTLGRILYRLGRGEWGKTEDHPIAMGVWNAVKQGRVLESLTEAAAGEGGHRGSRAYATEALWLFEKGGWRETFKGR